MALSLNGTAQVGFVGNDGNSSAVNAQAHGAQAGATGMLSKRVVAGERVNLSKAFATATGAEIKNWALGLSWNPKPGFTADCDVSIILTRRDAMGNDAAIHGKNYTEYGGMLPKALCFYAQPELPGLKSYGDNLDGVDGAFATPTGCDEQIDVDLDQVFAPYGGAQEGDSVIIIATTHNEQTGPDGQPNGMPAAQLHLGKVGSPVLRVYDNTNPSVPAEKFHFILDEEFSIATAVDVAKFYFMGGEWKYVSMNDVVSDITNPSHAFGLQAILDKFNIG